MSFFKRSIGIVLSRIGLNNDNKPLTNLETSNSKGRRLRACFRHISKLTMILLGVIIPLFVFSRFQPTLFYDMMFNARAILYRHQWYRTLTSQYVFETVPQLLIGFMLFGLELQNYEKKWGTFLALIDFIWRNFLINLSFMQIELFLFFYITSNLVTWSNFGLCGVTLAYITTRWYKNPNGYTKFYQFSKKIKNSYYLLVFLVIYSILHRGFPMVAISAILLGSIHDIFEQNIYKSLNKLEVLKYKKATTSPGVRDNTNASSNEIDIPSKTDSSQA